MAPAFYEVLDKSPRRYPVGDTDVGPSGVSPRVSESPYEAVVLAFLSVIGGGTSRKIRTAREESCLEYLSLGGHSGPIRFGSGDKFSVGECTPVYPVRKPTE